MKEQAVEVAVFLFLIVLSMILSLFVVRQGSLSFVLTAVATIFRDLGLVSLILFFLWRNGENVEITLIVLAVLGHSLLGGAL